jgi:Xaa-Pro aminopeptidase
MDPIVAVGERAAVAHSSHAGALIEAGQPVFIELSGVRASYTAPLMRTAIVGDPPADVEELASRSIAAIDAVVGAAGHGVPACDVAQAGLRALGPVLSRVRFHHLFGYPVGLGVPPSWLEESGFWLTATNPRPLQAGMVFHLPMTLRIPGRLGVGFSETLIITATGAEIGGSTARALHRG